MQRGVESILIASRPQDYLFYPLVTGPQRVEYCTFVLIGGSI
jgi:hypothetical protein